ncbi:MAG: thioredoxin fold domain-containing protein [Balneolaceae bacterium]|nr:thioredoxin fold domain-containing protein [Balneolaceae bacterium]
MSRKFHLFLLLPVLAVIYAFSSFSSADITWYELKEAQQLAKQNGKKVLIYAEASWCGYCKKMEAEVFPVQAVQDSMEKYYYPVRVDIESDKKMLFNGETMTGSQFARKHRVSGTPTTFFVSRDGKILGAQPGFIPPKVFKNLLSFVGSGAFGRIGFEEYVEMHGQKE